MLNASNVGVWHLHVPTGQVTRNRVFVGMTHIPADELASGLSVWVSRIHAADREEVLSKRRQLLAGELDSYWVDYRVRRTGGGWVSLRAHVAVIESSSAGQPIWVGGILFDVSREKELERRMHAVFDRPFQFIGLLTPEGVVVETSRSTLRHEGHEANDVLGKLFWEGPQFANSPELQQRLRDGVGRAAAGELVRFEVVNPAGDGSAVTVDFTLTPLRDDDGNIVNVIPEGRDITDLARTREMLREMEGRLTTATQAANIGLWKWELKTDEVWFSDHWYRMSGLQRSAAPTTRKTWTDLVHPADRRRVKFELDKHASGELAEYRMQFRMRRADNSRGWYLSIARAIDDGDGQISRVAGVLMDITDQHSIEERLAVATASANIGLWDIQYPDGPVWFSDQWWSMLGYGPTDVPTSMASFLSLIHPDDRAHSVSAMRKHRDGVNLDVDIELRMRCKDGSWRWIHSKGRAVERALDGAPARVSGVHIDITERKEAESRLTAAERLESIGRLAAGVAHEINTPVQYVNDSIYFVREGVTELLAHMNELQTRLGAAPAMAPELLYLQEHLPAALDRTVDGLARIAEIVRSMREFSYADQEYMSPVDLNRSIQSTLVVATSEYKYVANIETDLANLPPVTCHGSQISQVVLNLVVNAAHAIADVVKGTDDMGLITVKTFVDGDEVVICVTDTGGGIPEQIRHRIFEPFFTTKEVGKGTGQGLSIASNVVAQGHGGSISFQTEPGKGTTFYVRLPIEGRGVARATAAA